MISRSSLLDYDHNHGLPSNPDLHESLFRLTDSYNYGPRIIRKSDYLPDEINLLTFNCWGLKFISSLRSERMSEIAKQLTCLKPLPDIVCLQEIWTEEDYERLRRKTNHLLPHHKFYYSGVFGGGLAILSRWPIIESSMTGYPLNGRPTAFFRGDWYVGKGIARASIKIGPGAKDVVEVFNTHTHAPYGQAPHSQYTCHRTAQAWEMSKHLRAAADRGRLVIAMGDYNMLPLSLAHRIITNNAPVRDAWRVIHPNSSVGPADHPAEAHRETPTAEYNITKNGCTSDGVYNTWRWSKEERAKLSGPNPPHISPTTPDPRGKRLDYIFVSTESTSSTGGKDAIDKWVVDSVSMEMTHRHPTEHCSLSDHFAVRATIKRYGHDVDVWTPDHVAQLDSEQDYEHKLDQDTFDEILAMVKDFVAGEYQQRTWRAYHFYASLFLWLVCVVINPFIGKVGVLTTILGSLILVSGVVDGLIALLFFSWELRNLREFNWEIQNAKNNLPGNTESLPCEEDIIDKEPETTQQDQDDSDSNTNVGKSNNDDAQDVTSSKQQQDQQSD